jgi:hypothetical protein
MGGPSECAGATVAGLPSGLYPPLLESVARY